MDVMKPYIGVKMIKALPMSRGEYNTFRGWALPENENGDDEGYLVEYLDGGKANTERYQGYVSWSPADVFSRAYTELSGIPFSVAINALKVGLRISRNGWNGKGMFLYYVPAGEYPARTKAAKRHFGGDGLVPYRDYIAMKTVDEQVVPWVASQSDLLAEDWEVMV